MAAPVGSASIAILPSLKGFQSAVGAELTGTLDSEGKKGGNKLGGSILGAFKGFVGPAMVAAGVAAVGSFVTGAIRNAGELEQSVGAIDAVFKSGAGGMHAFAQTASQAFGLTRNEANELATVLGSQLKNGGTSIAELGGKTQELIGVGGDLAAMFGGTTADAVGALSSALKGERDPIERYGVSLTQAAIDAEAASLGFSKVGGSLSAEANQAATLSLIMKQTADAHGAAARESGSLQAQQARLSSGWVNLQASIGQAFLPAAAGAVGIIADLVAGAGPLLSQIGPGLSSMFATAGPAFTQLGAALLQLLPNLSPVGIAFQALMPVLPVLGELLAQVATVLAGNLTAAATALAPLVQQIAAVLSGVLAMALPIIADLFTQLAPVLGLAAELFGTLVQAIAPLISSLLETLMPILESLMPLVEVVFGFIVDVITVAINLVKGIIDAVMAALSGDWDKAWQIIGTTLAQAWDGITRAVGQALDGLLQWFGDLLPAIGNAIAGIGQWLWDAGVDLVQGLIDGVLSMAGALWDGIVGMVDGAVEGVKDFLGIHSPSRLFRSFGENIGQGLIIGIDSMSDSVESSAADLALAAVNGFGAPSVGLDVDPGTGLPAIAAALGTGYGDAPTVVTNYYDNSTSQEDKQAKLRRAHTELERTVNATALIRR